MHGNLNFRAPFNGVVVPYAPYNTESTIVLPVHVAHYHHMASLCRGSRCHVSVTSQTGTGAVKLDTARRPVSEGRSVAPDTGRGEVRRSAVRSVRREGEVAPTRCAHAAARGGPRWCPNARTDPLPMAVPLPIGTCHRPRPSPSPSLSLPSCGAAPSWRTGGSGREREAEVVPTAAGG